MPIARCDLLILRRHVRARSNNFDEKHQKLACELKVVYTNEYRNEAQDVYSEKFA